MAMTINNLLREVGLNPANLRRVKWGEKFACQEIGIYIVSTCSDSSKNENLYSSAPIDDKMLAFWLNKVPGMKLDGNRPSVQELKQRLADFWLPKENIVYIGQTENSLAKRVGQYYITELGDAKPHAGGHWLKTLKILNDLWVYYLPCPSPKEVEEKLLDCFWRLSSQKESPSLLNENLLLRFSKENLVLPFANLELTRGKRKKHGITGSTLKS